MWLKGSGLKIETESLIEAAQEQALSTKYFPKKILKQQIKCRICHNQVESISHIISGCSILAPTEYAKRHNRVANYIHWKIFKHFEIDTKSKYYKLQPQNVINMRKGTILWDKTIFTDRELLANRPDMIFIIKKKNRS